MRPAHELFARRRAVADSMQRPPKVAVVVLNWNGLADTSECLDSLRRITYPNRQTIVVDNGSSGDEAKALQERFGDFTFGRSDERKSMRET